MRTNELQLAQPGSFSDALAEVLRDGGGALLGASGESINGKERFSRSDPSWNGSRLDRFWELPRGRIDFPDA
jgi:hypothetical protein